MTTAIIASALLILGGLAAVARPAKALARVRVAARR